MKRFRESAVITAIALFALLVLPHRVLAAEPAGAPAHDPGKMEAPGGHGMHPMTGMKPHMMEGMKQHMEEVRKGVAALREHEKKLEGITDPAEFRKAAIEHFRMLDDLQESHVKHMDSMMGGGGHKHGHH